MNKLAASFRIALRALRLNKTRSALTMLGIIIGVAAVVAMVAIGSGAEERIREQIASIGSNVIVVLSGSLTTSGIRMGTGNAQTLTEDDARMIARECGGVAFASPVVRGGAQIVYAGNNWGTQVLGVTPDYLSIRDIEIQSGQPFMPADVDSAAPVALVGKTVIDNLFASEDPLGRLIRIKTVNFTVIGTLVPKGQSPSGQDQDDVVLVPISAAKKKVLGTNKANYSAVAAIMVQARPGLTSGAMDEMKTLLRQRHRLQANEDDDFTIRNMEEVFRAQETSARVMSILLAAIASVSLMVGGIGIMNIMLVSVTERTREIGLRQAVGARTGDILAQFLVEAVTLSVAGGAIGIALGVVATISMSLLTGWSTSLSGGSMTLAFVFSALVGIFFGYYPARKAAFMDPIDALRFE